LLWTLQLPRRTTPGAHVTALLTYRVDNATPQSPPFSLYVHLLTNSGKPVTQEDEAAPAFPNLASGDTVLQRFTLALPSSTPPQLLNVSVGGYIASSLKPLRWQTPQGQLLPPGSFLTHILIPPPSPASPSFRTTLQFADGIRLLGYTLTQHGRTLRVTLDWEATEKLHTHYTAYVHLLSPRGKLIAQNDAPPAAGNFPTTFWHVGNHIADRHLLELPPDLPPGSYLLQIGLYNSQTLQPLLLLEGHNRFPITLHSQ
jgi:hypothetical protein